MTAQDNGRVSLDPLTPAEALRALLAIKQSWLDEYQGLGLDEAKARAEAEGRTYQVIGPDSVITADFNANRLNLIVDGDGNLTGMRAS